MIRMKSQKCVLTSRMLVLSLSISSSKYNRAPSIYSTNVGCNDIVSRSITHELNVYEKNNREKKTKMLKNAFCSITGWSTMLKNLCHLLFALSRVRYISIFTRICSIIVQCDARKPLMQAHTLLRMFHFRQCSAKLSPIAIAMHHDVGGVACSPACGPPLHVYKSPVRPSDP